MITLVLGASGATGKQLVEQLLNMRQEVKVVIRPTGKIPDTWKNNVKISITSKTFDMSDICCLTLIVAICNIFTLRSDR